MKIFLVGATGRTGRWILKAALEKGFKVTALVRGGNTRGLEHHPSLTILAGDLLTMDDLATHINQHDAILSALSSDVVYAGTQKMILAAERAGVQRFIGIAGGGILQLDETHLRRERPGYPAAFLKGSAGHLTAWQALERSVLQWTLVCTPDLTDGPASGLAKHRENYMPDGGKRIPRGDVAEFMMAELQRPRFLRTRVGLTV